MAINMVGGIPAKSCDIDTLTEFKKRMPLFNSFIACSHDSTTQLMSLICKIELQALIKCLATAWQVHDEWITTSRSCAMRYNWSTTAWQVDNYYRLSWAWSCHFMTWIMVVVESCCHVNSTRCISSVIQLNLPTKTMVVSRISGPYRQKIPSNTGSL